MTYPVHTVDTAPEGAKPTLTAAQKGYGFIPNLLGVMANAPALVAAYTTLSGIFDTSSLSPAERQTVLLTTSYENECAYCMAAHSAIAGMQKVPQHVIDSIRAGAPIADAKLEALRQFTRMVVISRGWPTDAETAAFLAAGYGPQQVLEVVLGVGLKTLSNYTNHLAETPLDAAFAPAAWTKAA
ncbi:MAG: carboxymuconolactone decarboxylase family protein [Phenylobacterium sp.]|uniref:carboxymuconolactone decarboxylase family protein n=1 Tax=Phenylobacterium sp. TaxID=1871053 RepID=UPI0025D2411D|nr:carboxymuconolactone decarboxylase family protein [Phenylobacterium sp.]MBI1196248.1 carboxymuconolactone decarboxylase family protein [Phenylobacterium sp.]